MTHAIVWWHWLDDRASHAFVTTHGPRLMTQCGYTPFAWRVDRVDRGPRCLACRIAVENKR